MYYEERIRFGRVYWRGTPNGKWILKRMTNSADKG